MLALWLVGGYFSLDNPWPGYLWLQSCILAIHEMAGMILTNMSMSGYDMCYDKSTGLLHNMPFGWLLGTRKVREKIQVVLRGKVWFQGKSVYRTQLVEPYPLDLTDQYAEVATLSLSARADALGVGLPTPMAWKGHDFAPLARPGWYDDEVLASQWWNDAPDIQEPMLFVAMVCQRA